MGAAPTTACSHCTTSRNSSMNHASLCNSRHNAARPENVTSTEEGSCGSCSMRHLRSTTSQSHMPVSARVGMRIASLHHVTYQFNSSTHLSRISHGAAPSSTPKSYQSLGCTRRSLPSSTHQFSGVSTLCETTTNPCDGCTRRSTDTRYMDLASNNKLFGWVACWWRW